MDILAGFKNLGANVIVCAIMAGPVLAQEAQVRWEADDFAMTESVLWDAGTGLFYVSDTFGNAVYRLEGEGLAVVARGAGLAGANGLLPGPEGTLLVANLGDISGGFENIVPGWVVSLDLDSGLVEPYGATQPPGVLDGIVSDGKAGVVLTDNGAGAVLHQMPGAAPVVIATIATGAADLDYDIGSGVINCCADHTGGPCGGAFMVADVVNSRSEAR